MIQPEWHGWMHHMFDETPDQFGTEFDTLATTSVSHAIYHNHIGLFKEAPITEQVDVSQYRQRGYKVGNLMRGPDDKDLYYKQPGHPLSEEKGGRFNERKETTEWTP